MIKDVSERLLGQFVERMENKLATPETTEADTMSKQESGADPNADEEGSHMTGGEHMSGGGHMSGGAHMSGGSHMSGRGPLSDEEPSQDKEDAKDVSEPSGKGAAPASQAPSTRRTIDGPEAEPVDLVAASGGFKRLWPVAAAVVVVVAGLLIGYVVFG